MPDPQQGATIETDVPAKLDRLPWSRWHARIIVALGTSWLLDGLEVTMVGSLSGILKSQAGLHLTDPQVTGAATTYLAGAVAGALLFGYLTDRLGRRKLFLVTLATYSIATVASAFSWGFGSFALFRFFTGLGIGGEYAAINSAVDELIPGKVRGTVDLVVNGTFWLGATLDRWQPCSSSRGTCRKTPAGDTRSAWEDRWAALSFSSGFLCLRALAG
jgi:sugar phosphate permease